MVRNIYLSGSLRASFSACTLFGVFFVLSCVVVCITGCFLCLGTMDFVGVPWT